MNKTALVIMAAGMGSRYGGGIKQLEQVGVSGEIIMEYSIYDAIAAHDAPLAEARMREPIADAQAHSQHKGKA